MHDDTAEGRAVAARTTAAWLAYGERTATPRTRVRIDWREVAAYVGIIAVWAVGMAAYFFA